MIKNIREKIKNRIDNFNKFKYDTKKINVNNKYYELNNKELDNKNKKYSDQKKYYEENIKLIDNKLKKLKNESSKNKMKIEKLEKNISKKEFDFKNSAEKAQSECLKERKVCPRVYDKTINLVIIFIFTIYLTTFNLKFILDLKNKMEKIFSR